MSVILVLIFIFPVSVGLLGFEMICCHQEIPSAVKATQIKWPAQKIRSKLESGYLLESPGELKTQQKLCRAASLTNLIWLIWGEAPTLVFLESFPEVLNHAARFGNLTDLPTSRLKLNWSKCFPLSPIPTRLAGVPSAYSWESWEHMLSLLTWRMGRLRSLRATISEDVQCWFQHRVRLSKCQWWWR